MMNLLSRRDLKPILSISILIFMALPCLAAQRDKIRILSLSQWRSQQVIRAQNQAVRISNKIAKIKATTGKLKDIKRLESEQRVAAQNIELVKEITVEDYFNVYLSQFSESDIALVQAAKTMTKSEVAQLLKLLLKNKSLAGTLTAPTSSIITGIQNSRTTNTHL